MLSTDSLPILTLFHGHVKNLTFLFQSFFEFSPTRLFVFLFGVVLDRVQRLVGELKLKF
jgi:hypothetical protein